MRILVTSDIHGNKALVYLIRRTVERENVDALIIAGDIAPKAFYTLFDAGFRYDFYSPFPLRNKKAVLSGAAQVVEARLDLLGYIENPGLGLNPTVFISKQKEKLGQICELLRAIDVPVYMLIGNDDHIVDEDWDGILDDYGILNLNSRTHMLGELKVTGFQYVPPTPWNTNNERPESELSQKLDNIRGQVDTDTVLVTHGPPMGTLDVVTSGLHVGSESVLQLVKDKQPVFHVFGHIHEAFGSARIGGTICCNVSCMWTDWFLRGYLLDTKGPSIRKIEEEVSLETIGSLL
ncbi:MAG: metallophosphoesterase [Phycisphaerae bacterium]|jgi:Icc-related predicted phosphoesterase|nr:metallophosphoesterase [Phycisphaerae bacterium]